MAVARSFAEQGASWVHVVDLSAAFGEDEDACAANSAAIKAICGVDGLSVDVGGASARSRASMSWPAMVLAASR